MSRRKQGRPQQRKTLDSLELEPPHPWCIGTGKSISLLRTIYAYLDRVEQENDLLVCGDCQARFPLHDIVHFIRHKKLCCDKENLSTSDCRKQDNNNDTDTDSQDGDHDQDELEGVSSGDKPRPSQDDMEVDGDDEEDSGDKPTDLSAKVKDDVKTKVAVKLNDLSAKVKNVSTKLEVKAETDEQDKRSPLKQKQLVDAECNTTHSEPSRVVCETCRSTYTSAWALLQHAQREHGMKIYTSPPPPTSSTPATPTPAASNSSPIDLVVSPRSLPSASVSPFPVHPPNPFTSHLRLPLDTRLQHPTPLGHFTQPAINIDLINDPRLRPHLIRPLGLDASTFHPGHFDPSRRLQHVDYNNIYSMTLQQIAKNPPVPAATAAAASTKSSTTFPSTPTPSVASTPSVTPKPHSPSVEPSPTASSPKGSTTTSPSTTSSTKKSCEFCGKQFRFLSNLIVHRRSHTGEKPFKCPICPHACTQQSKLKRHMKTHAVKTDGSDSHSNADMNIKSELNEAEDEEEGEEEEEEEEEEEGEEEEDEDYEGEEEMNEEEREVLEQMKASNRSKDEGETSGPEPGEIRHDAKRIKLEKEAEPVDEDQPSDLSMPKVKDKHSLLSEVMKNSGLTNISAYHEAYQAALAESRVNGKDSRDSRPQSTQSAANDEADSISSESSKSKTVKKEAEEPSKEPNDKEKLYINATSLLGKAGQKRDSSGLPAHSPNPWPATVTSLAARPPHLDPIANSVAAYALMHHPQPWPLHPENHAVRFFRPGYIPRFPHTSLTPDSTHNGLSLAPPTSTSALLKSENPLSLFKPSLTSPTYRDHRQNSSSSTTPSPNSNLLLPSNGSTPRKDRNRNDTCEFCGKVFKNCSNLTVHRRSHTGEKPYKCSLCSYACAQSSKLTRHMKTHGRMGKDVFKCKFCNMPFSVPSTLEKHMRKCVENRNARLMGLNPDSGSESNGEMVPLSPIDSISTGSADGSFIAASALSRGILTDSPANLSALFKSGGIAGGDHSIEASVPSASESSVPPSPATPHRSNPVSPITTKSALFKSPLGVEQTSASSPTDESFGAPKIGAISLVKSELVNEAGDVV